MVIVTIAVFQEMLKQLPENGHEWLHMHGKNSRYVVEVYVQEPDPYPVQTGFATAKKLTVSFVVDYRHKKFPWVPVEPIIISGTSKIEQFG